LFIHARAHYFELADLDSVIFSGINMETKTMIPPINRIGIPIRMPIRDIMRIQLRRIKSTPPMNIFFLISVV